MINRNQYGINRQALGNQTCMNAKKCRFRLVFDQGVHPGEGSSVWTQHFGGQRPMSYPNIVARELVMSASVELEIDSGS